MHVHIKDVRPAVRGPSGRRPRPERMFCLAARRYRSLIFPYSLVLHLHAFPNWRGHHYNKIASKRVRENIQIIEQGPNIITNNAPKGLSRTPRTMQSKVLALCMHGPYHASESIYFNHLFARTDVFKHSLFHRFVRTWSSLPKHDIN